MMKPKFFKPELDSLRFMAFMLIFFHHNGLTHIFLVDQIKHIGWIGVDIFFCLSAFLLTRLLLLEMEAFAGVSVSKFFVRRILRIWPLYFVYVVMGILFSWYEGILTSENWLRAVGLLTFTDNIFASWYGYNPIRFTGHLWTISYEEQFYMVLPFVIQYLAPKRAGKIQMFLGACLLVGLVIRLFFIYAQVKHPAIWVLPLTHFESILVGIFLAFNHGKTERINSMLYFLSAVMSIAIIVMLPETNVISYHLMIIYPCIGIASGSVLCLVLYGRTPWIKSLLSNQALAFLGRISFGLYVFHNFCISLITYVLKESQTTVFTFLLSLLLTIIMASLSYLLLEKPFLEMKKKFTLIPSRLV